MYKTTFHDFRPQNYKIILICAKKVVPLRPQIRITMENNTLELSLMDAEERELVEYIYNAIPAEDRGALSADDILFVLDAMDDYLEEQGLLREDPKTGEMEYLDGEVDETEQLNYVLQAAKEDQRTISGVQIQLIQDAELQYGIAEGYYSEE